MIGETLTDIDLFSIHPLNGSNPHVSTIMYDNYWLGSLKVDLNNLPIHYNCNHSGVKDSMMYQ
jgi:hypothetical protein